ncbi:MAG: hypothetical protein A3F84_13005 [Candidatus Handelsmanbacteria bacterium RIFCSPLOWO2_12_FULL_64_10]|uniref:Uncharacterized protein n=1 Tax=Handelsmanbacteria sp. (strain RIFCSPLOWO2_12_FULL_64_10) TaxID=1817868 RepID=A0A1F6C4H0_HANXR|nr:MAG: hypothetical protein A3F84_13005 [Candidatus Handelsmanbacteria bacterium RIFCSPLOWO2_12_FULL_64_10]
MFWIRDGIAKYIKEGRLQEIIRQSDGLCTFTADGGGLVQNCGNSLLLLYWGKKQCSCISIISIKARYSGGSIHFC